MSKYFFSLSVALNIGLLFFISWKFNDRGRTINSDSLSLEDRIFLQARVIGKTLPANLTLVNRTDSILLKDIVSEENKVVLLTGYKSCTSCLNIELDRLVVSEKRDIVVIAHSELEDELMYFWRKNKMSYPIYFTHMKNLKLNEEVLSQPSYVLLGRENRLLNMLMTHKEDHWSIVNNFLNELN